MPSVDFMYKYVDRIVNTQLKIKNYVMQNETIAFTLKQILMQNQSRALRFTNGVLILIVRL